MYMVYPCYLYENYNVYYLVDHIIPFPSSEDIFLAYYSKHPQLYVKQILQNRAKPLELITIKVLHGLIMF